MTFDKSPMKIDPLVIAELWRSQRRIIKDKSMPMSARFLWLAMMNFTELNFQSVNSIAKTLGLNRRRVIRDLQILRAQNLLSDIKINCADLHKDLVQFCTKTACRILLSSLYNSFQKIKNNQNRRSPKIVQICTTTKHHKRTSATHHVLATMLAKAIRTAYGYKLDRHLLKWTAVFQKMQDEDDFDLGTISSVLKWYCHLMVTKELGRLPVCLNAGFFRSCFPDLHIAWRQSAPIEACKIDPTIVKAAGECLAEYRRDPRFDRLDRIEIEDFVNLCDRFGRWRDGAIRRLRKSRRRKDLGSSNRAGIVKSISALRSAPYWALIEFIAVDVRGWDDWTGSLKAYMPERTKFKKFIEDYLNGEGCWYLAADLYEKKTS